MAHLNEKRDDFKQALDSWKEALDTKYSDITRDASIQRFEFTFELLWKVVKLYLKEQEDIECVSPKSCIREARTILSISDEDTEACLKMAKDRNFSVHTYSEDMAKALYDRLSEYYDVSLRVYEKISKNT
ncbi:nucleotidyltransferase substrate binding protein [Patescibacteria group bacterium]|nr:nucleotidyltransferase substrate binding protein [Patescibacteria group bacterium]